MVPIHDIVVLLFDPGVLHCSVPTFPQDSNEYPEHWRLTPGFRSEIFKKILEIKFLNNAFECFNVSFVFELLQMAICGLLSFSMIIEHILRGCFLFCSSISSSTKRIWIYSPPPPQSD